MTYSGRESRTCISGIGVNAAGVAGVATPNILTIVLFFPSAELGMDLPVCIVR